MTTWTIIMKGKFSATIEADTRKEAIEKASEMDAEDMGNIPWWEPVKSTLRRLED